MIRKKRKPPYRPCDICGGGQPYGMSSGRVRLDQDHDERTGQIRGFLCRTCNGGVGMFREDPELMEAAARYIRKWRRTKRKPGDEYWRIKKWRLK